MAQALDVPWDKLAVDPHTDYRLFARVGLFMVSLDCEDLEPVEVIARLRRALEADPRVDQLSGDKLDVEWTTTDVLYPHGQGETEDPDAVLDGHDHKHVLTIPDELTFSVQVPSKNQKLLIEGERVPERYMVKWNGTVACVLWMESRPTMSAGCVIREVLGEAAVAAGFGFYTQACSSACEFPFLHRTAVLVSQHGSFDGDMTFDISEGWDEVSEGRDEVIGRGPEGSSSRELADLFYSTIAFDTRRFSQLKNVGRRIMDLEDTARDSLRSLLALQYQHTCVRGDGVGQYFRRRLALRGWRAESRKLVSRVWLAVASLEVLQRRWARLRSEFEAGTRTDTTLLLFEGDHHHDAEQVSTLDVGGLATAVEQASSRLDTMALTSATTWGALAGGAAGAAVGALVQLA